ncbi:phosphoribosylformylglycinamidine synthase subunit PurQ [Candidatus Sumerlaeota bacterium]|nr:phosphoribosylformylglycinamidine synthase subunit PurQ [Candidatus Sumerlaeota bacterium]
MKAGVVVFPGSNCDQDCFHVLRNVAKVETEYLWHRDATIPSDVGLVCLPGGFTYGDYLRVGAMAHVSPIVRAVKEFAARGGFVIGVCNGFQILTESGLLPGALMHNDCLKFLCKTVPLKVERHAAPWTDFEGEVLRVPIAHGQGNYYIDPDGLERLQDNGQILFRYSDPDGDVSKETNPNGSVDNIAGITNEKGNVLGMMPHPERCSESELGNTDGLRIWESVLGHCR